MASSSDDELEAPPVPTRRRSSRQLDDDEGSYRLRKRATNLAPITHTKPSKNAPASRRRSRAPRPRARRPAVLGARRPQPVPGVRAALERRGWTEVPESTRHVHLLWSLKTDEVDALLESGAVRPATALNHFRRNYELITKHGLARNLRATDDDVDIDGVMPRSYFLRDVGQLREFLADYVVTAARAALHAALAGRRQRRRRAARAVAYAVARRFLVRLPPPPPPTRPPTTARRRGARGGCSGARHCAHRSRHCCRPNPNGMRSSLRGLASCRRGRRSGAATRPPRPSPAAAAAGSGSPPPPRSPPPRRRRRRRAPPSRRHNWRRRRRQRLPPPASRDEPAAAVAAEASLPQSSMDAAAGGGANGWILKSVGLSRGRGISIATELPTILSRAEGKRYRLIAQKYVERPLLLLGRCERPPPPPPDPPHSRRHHLNTSHSQEVRRAGLGPRLVAQPAHDLGVPRLLPPVFVA